MSVEYIYTDKDGKPIHKVIRDEKDGKKTFSQQHYINGCWINGLNGVDTVIYKLPNVIEAVENGKPVIIVEGEKDVDGLLLLGFTATTNPMGAGKWKEEYKQYFSNADVYIIADNDKYGFDHAKKVAANLKDVCNSVKMIWLCDKYEGLPTKSDITDYLKLKELTGEAAIDDINALLETAENADLILESERNNTLFKEACKLRGQGKTDKEIKRQISDMNKKRCFPLYNDNELNGIINRACEYPQGNKENIKGLNTFSLSELQNKDIEPLKWIIKDFLPQGLTIFASPPKYGKSWFVLYLCICVGFGEDFLGFKTEKNGCLYLALEDSDRRLKERMTKLLCGRSAPDNVDCAVLSETIGTGLIEQLKNYINQKPSTSLIVIDTLQKVRNGIQNRQSAYENDYNELGALKRFADENNISVLVVHHVKKSYDDDEFNRISGTNGILGCADVAMILCKESRRSNETKLTITGRDVEDNVYNVTFDKDTCRWSFNGTDEQVESNRIKTKYYEDPIVITIKNKVNENPDGYYVVMKDLLNEIKAHTGITVAKSPQGLSRQLNDLYKYLLEYDNIEHGFPTSNGGNKGRRHKFYKK